MKLNWIDQLGNWNPQLLREIKGRCKPRNLLLAGAISGLGQFLLVMLLRTELPILQQGFVDISNRYCTGTLISEYNGRQHQCLADSFGNFVINWQLWCLDLFTWLSLTGIFALLVAGAYLLISDLAHEERRDTLNFIRLSPQLPQGILWGKMLGVPILLYIVAGLAIPLHLWSGFTAHIPLTLILSFYGVLFASCLCFYSAALLFSLVSSWLGSFQAWLGSGALLIFLFIATFKPFTHTPADWLNLFSPALILSKLIAATQLYSQSRIPNIADLQWFYLPLGTHTVGIISLALLNYGLWTYWSWQALKRRFPNPTKTVLSKRQSYLLVACFEVVIIGFAATSPKWPVSTELSVNFQMLLGLNLLLLLGLIVALTPHRQGLQDWARYRREQVSYRKRFWNRALVEDLLWGDKSPALVAIALNLAIVATFLLPWIVLKLQNIDKLPAIVSLVIGCNLILIYAAIAQMLMFLRTQKQALWVMGAVGAAVIVPPAILNLLSLQPSQIAGLWLFTPFAWTAIEQASISTILFALLGQWTLLILSTLKITRQLQQAGESASKALFAARPSLKD